MEIPKTYEEFLKTPKDELKKIALSDLTLDQATKIVKYLNRLESDGKNLPIIENVQKQKSTYWEDLYGDLK